MEIFLKLNNNLRNSSLSNAELEQLKPILNELENEMETLTFLNERREKEKRVNEKFIKKTVQLLELKNIELKKNNNALIESNKKLKLSNAELERFAYIASHDLKTPLYNIIKFSQYLKSLMLLEKQDDENTIKSLQFIVDNGKRMNELIDGILEYSRLTNVKNSKEGIYNMQQIFADISNVISTTIQEKNVYLDIQTELPKIKNEYHKVFILFKNLIENAIKYNDSEQPKVKIYSNMNCNNIEFHIEDNGIGIKEKFFDKVFVMFERLHNYSDIPGTGLGLATCKKIAIELGGSISLKSSLGEGSTFTVKMPLHLFEM